MQSAKAARESARLKLETLKVTFGSAILGGLTVVYAILLVCGRESNALLAVIAAGVGYLFGGRGTNTPG